jgi:hypothetical protein
VILRIICGLICLCFLVVTPQIKTREGTIGALILMIVLMLVAAGYAK